MAEEVVPNSIIDALKDVLTNSSDTLTTYTSEPKTETTSIEQIASPSAPLRTPENDPNYKIWQEAFEKTGDENVLVRTDLTPETISEAASLLVQSPEFKNYIGQYALSNDVTKNLDVLNDAINSQKRYTEDMSKETDGNFFKSKDSYFLQQILTGLNQTGKADDFFKELRDKVNAEFVTKEETDKIPLAGSPDDEPDALQKVAQLLEQREGEIVEDATTNEKLDELKRMLGTPEYKQARIEELGYDPDIGHPDLEIRDYLKAKADWAKQPYYDRGPEPVKPQNFEERVNLPKTDLDNQKKQETTSLKPQTTKPLNFTEPLEEAPTTEQTTSLFNVPNTFKEASFVKNVEPLQTPSLKSNITNNEVATLSDIAKLFEAQNTEVISPEIGLPINNELTESLSVKSELPQNETWSAFKSNDEISENILTNTEVTNNILQSLTELLQTFIQTTASSQALNENVSPPSLPTNISRAPGTRGNSMSDLARTSTSGMISNIRNKF